MTFAYVWVSLLSDDHWGWNRNEDIAHGHAGAPHDEYMAGPESELRAVYWDRTQTVEAGP